MLIIFGGLPGTGKTSIACELAREIGATHVRVDSIEEAIRKRRQQIQPCGEEGYLAAYAIAGDNVRIGRTVIADSVNPLQITRDAWIAVANVAQVSFVEVEIICSDVKEHRKRLETRICDVSGLRPLTWDDVTSREYHSWDRGHVVLDTANLSIAENVQKLREILER